MFSEFSSFLSAFWLIYSFSFLVALTGAMSPGPLMTYTIIKSVQTRKRGYLVGFWVILGHGILEMTIVILLLAGFSHLLKSVKIVRFIGVAGGAILIYFGYSIIRDVLQKKIVTDFTKGSNEGGSGEEKTDNDPADPKLSGSKKKITGRRMKSYMENPVIGGILVSMSNPYWWVWWATIGLAFMVQFQISFLNPENLIAFYLGHETGDLLWYMIISSVSFFGMKKMNQKAYSAILVLCGVFMIFFGLFLGAVPFLKYPVLS